MPKKGFSNGFGPGFGASLNVATVALKVGVGAGYEDGDILGVFNRRQIRRVWAQHICSVRSVQRNANGLIPSAHHSRDWYEATHQYRFERVSSNEVLRTVIATATADLLSNTANAAGEQIDVAEFIRRRKKSVGFGLFGSVGSEVWYGGQTDTADDKLDAVWTAIETKTAYREVDFPDWPAGVQELKSHLFLQMNDMTDAEADELTASEIDNSDPDNPITIRKRRQKIDWRSHRELLPHITNIDDRNVSVDLRNSVGRLVRGFHNQLKG